MRNYGKLDSLITIRPSSKEGLGKSGFKFMSQFIENLYYTQKMTLRETAKSVGVSQQALRGWMNAFGMQRRGQGGNQAQRTKLSPEIIAKALSMDGKATIKKTAEMCGCSTESVRRIWGRLDRPKSYKRKISCQPDLPDYTKGATARGWTPEERAAYNLELSRRRYRAHRGDTLVPLPEYIQKYAEYQGV